MMIENRLKFNCEKAVEFIEACFDENNGKDCMSFDERIQQRISTIPASVQDIVSYAVKEDEINFFELEELEEDLEDKDLISYLDEDLEEIF